MTKEQAKILKQELKKRIKKLSNSVLRKQLKKLNKNETSFNTKEVLVEKIMSRKEMTITEYKDYAASIETGEIKILLSNYRI